MYKSVFSILVLVPLLVSYQYLSAVWYVPEAVPPNMNIDPPINVGADTQVKSGNLNVNVLQTMASVWSNQYCDGLGQNCFTPTNRTGLPTCANGQTLVADATGTWVCGAPSPTIPPVAWLVNNQHSESQCTALGGTVMSDGSNRFCRFNQTSCPAGWAQYQNWTQTTSNTCSSGGNVLCPLSTCSVSGHSFANIAQESCAYTIGVAFGMGEGRDGNKGCNRSPGVCRAPINAVGCY